MCSKVIHDKKKYFFYFDLLNNFRDAQGLTASDIGLDSPALRYLNKVQGISNSDFINLSINGFYDK